MICRHRPGDTSCSKYGGGYSYTPEPKTPDSTKYTIERAARVGPHLVLEAKYPNCAKCKFEGRKIMVFLDVSETDALRWKKIDPHFRDTNVRLATEAPSPAARFPGNDEGWVDAMEYAKRKVKV